MLSLILLILGFALLVWGADKFVAGASALARRLGVSPLLVGLTIVAFGTSAPELAVSLTAAIQGANEIAVGNVVGSNIFNLLMVAGLSAVVCPLVMDRTLMHRDWPYSLLAALVLCAMITPDLTISRLEGVILLTLFALTLFFQIRTAIRGRGTLNSEEEEVMLRPFTIALYIVLGLACIIAGGQFAVNGATGIARMFSLSETLIGLTIVAIGTSLPELVTSLVAARRGQNEIAMGNVIGSNIFNILLILGLSSVITPIPVLSTSIIDSLVLIGITILFYLPARLSKSKAATDDKTGGHLARPVGAVMALCYIVYAVYLVMR